jgi:hypothetical protein
VDFVGL